VRVQALLEEYGRLGTLPSAEDVPSLAELARWSSPQPADTNHGNNAADWLWQRGNSSEPSAVSLVNLLGKGPRSQVLFQNFSS
jgi:hypothetical protein